MKKTQFNNDAEWLLKFYHSTHCTQTMTLKGEAAKNPQKLGSELAHDAGVKHYTLIKIV